MKIVTDAVSVLVIICMLGAMIYATKALKAGKGQKEEEKKGNLKMAGLFFVAYALLNLLRMYLMGNLG